MKIESKCCEVADMFCILRRNCSFGFLSSYGADNLDHHFDC